MPRRAVELFAGVGGFRLGLQNAGFETVWSNQWEPSRKTQHASDCYVKNFGPEGHTNVDIATVDPARLPTHELLVGGFPCQDYSVATTLSRAHGIQGKKGVLWWEIYRILKVTKTPHVLLENVDRLLRSPHSQRGRDFGIILWCLSSLGYSVEWRVINAADYGAPQKRRRLFIFAARDSTRLGTEMQTHADARDWLMKEGLFASAFHVNPDYLRELGPEPPHAVLPKRVEDLSASFAYDFQNAGLMRKGQVWTTRLRSKTDPTGTLGSILERDVDEKYFVPNELIERWKYLKGPKKEPRTTRAGFTYAYSEGGLPFPDRLDQPARTLITGEGGTSPSRFKHIILDPQKNRYRVLTPNECERLNGFTPGWTDTGMPPSWRYFCMGNALVVPLVERMGRELDRRLASPRAKAPHFAAANAIVPGRRRRL